MACTIESTSANIMEIPHDFKVKMKTMVTVIMTMMTMMTIITIVMMIMTMMTMLTASHYSVSGSTYGAFPRFS